MKNKTPEQNNALFKSSMNRKKIGLSVMARVTAIALICALLFCGCSKSTGDNTSGSASAESQSADIESQAEGDSTDTISGTDSVDVTSANTGNNQESSKTSSKQSGGINAKPSNTSSSSKKFVKPTYNLKGRELIVWGVTQPKKGTIEYESWKEVESEYNCKLKFNKVSYSVAVNKQTAAALSGSSECDIWCTQWYDTFPSFVAKGMVSPLSKYYDFDNDPNWKDMGGNVNNYWSGKLYGLNTGVSGPGWGLWYNKSLLQKENLEDPAKLVSQNKWTWDTFLSMCQKLTKKNAGDGKVTQYGYYDEYLFANLILTNGGQIVDINNADGPTFAMNSEASKYAIQFGIDLANKYGVVPSIGSIGDSTLLEMFPKGQVAFTTYAPDYGISCVSKGMKAEDLGYTYFPKGPNAKDYVVHGATLDMVYVVPPQVKDIAAVTCVLQDYICVWDSSEKFAVSRQDLLDASYTSNGFGKIYTNNKDFMLNGGKKNKPSYINNFFLGDTLNTQLWYPLIKGEVNIDTGIKKVTPVIQTKIDELTMQSVGG